MLAGFSVCTLFPKHLGVVSLELLNAGIGQGVMQHLLNDLVGHGGDVGTGQRTVGHMDGVADGSGNDLGVNVGLRVDYSRYFFSVSALCGTLDRRAIEREGESSLYQNNVTLSLGYMFR